MARSGGGLSPKPRGINVRGETGQNAQLRSGVFIGREMSLVRAWFVLKEGLTRHWIGLAVDAAQNVKGASMIPSGPRWNLPARQVRGLQ